MSETIVEGASRADELNSYLRDIYLNESNPAAFSSPRTLLNYLKQQPGRGDVSLKEVENFLKTQEIYTTHFPFKRPKYNTPVISPRAGYQFDIDSAYLPSDRKGANGLFVLAIDAFSRKIAAKAVKNLKGSSVASALKKIFAEIGVPQRVRTDAGTDYLNRDVKGLFKRLKIKHFIAAPPHKASLAERGHREIKSGLYKVMQARGKANWTGRMLHDTVDRYNRRVHTSTGVAPDSIVSAEDEASVWRYMSRKRLNESPMPKSFKFEINDPVRVAFIKNPFDKSYQESFSAQVYFVATRTAPYNTHRYLIKDERNAVLKGTFLESELTGVRLSADTKYRVDKVLGKKSINGRPHLKVSWHGYDSEFDSWIPASELQKLK